MMRTRDPRLRVPAVMAVFGTAIAAASLMSSGWGGALAVEVFTVAATIGYFVLGGRDSDIGAVFGSRADERQTSIGMQAAALAGNVAAVVAVAGFVIETALGESTWPFALFCGVIAVSFLGGLAFHRVRS